MSSWSIGVSGATMFGSSPESRNLSIESHSLRVVYRESPYPGSSIDYRESSYPGSSIESRTLRIIIESHPTQDHPSRVIYQESSIESHCHEKVISFSCGTSLIRSLFVMSTLFVMYTLFVLFGPYVFKNVPHRRT